MVGTSKGEGSLGMPRAVRGAFRALVATFLLVLVILGASATALAQRAAQRTRVSGSVVGGLRSGDKVTFRVQVFEARGYRDLQQISVTMQLHNLPLAELTYLAAVNSFSVRGGPLIEVGTPTTTGGSFFQFGGLDVTTQASGRTFTLVVNATVRADVPPGAEFQFTATNQDGTSASITRHLNIEEAGVGLGWGSVIVAVAGALFVGGFVGNLFASKRRPASRVSVYGTIQARLAEERARAK
jgi:hypothetical protein